MSKVKIGLLHTGIRGDEKLIISAAKKQKVDLELIDVRKQLLDPNDKNWSGNDIYLERAISTTKGFHMVQFLTEIRVPVLNPLDLAVICDSKFATTTRLMKADIPTVPAMLVFNEDQAKKAVETLGGYPVIVKSNSGSWGRLMAKVNDSDALESTLEHKSFLGGPNHSSFYIQAYIDKRKGRDIRAFVIGGKLIAAIYRTSSHWITNTARGAKATKVELKGEIVKICEDTARAMATPSIKDGGLLAIDVFESDNQMLINEVNHTIEFKNSETPTGVSISGHIVKYCVDYVKNR